MPPQFSNVKGGSQQLRTGYDVPLIGYGTYKVVGKDVLPAIDAALSAGYRLFDTAKYYKNEAELGAALKELLPKHGLKREEVFLTTKFFAIAAEDAFEEATRLVDESLESLGVEYLDMVLVHYPKADASSNDDPKNAHHRKSTYLALEKIKESGKIRSVGVSNYEISHLQEIESYGKELPCANQLEYHPHFVREPLHLYCKKHGIFFQAFSSLARQEPALIDDPVLVNIAKKHNQPVTLILLAWALNQGVGIIPKSATPSRIVDNIKVAEVKLSAEEIQELTSLDRGQHYIRCTGWLVK
ncbi:unnamed protein product [Caenorhabditis auriculariae]|uniref:NADP-dependent oxidoreductase domain-containing protein n=1 Tax=Caenorhabditis auriculariae TaxID=2777116 RepID=A0A8S1HH45_9PELO|nr:unnamed protein product [Caenorhabditis auriculariae]